MHRQRLVVGLGEDRAERLDVGVGRVEPFGPAGLGHDDRHPVVHRRHRLVGRRRDDGRAVQEATLRVLGVSPRGPQPGDRQRLAVEPVDVHRLLHRLALGGQRPVRTPRPPFVEAVHRDQQPLLLEQPLVGRLLGECLGAGVDHPRGDLAVLGPARDQAPVEGLDAGHPVRSGHHAVDVLGRRDVEVLAEALDVGLGAEELRDLVRLGRGHEPSAHRNLAQPATGSSAATSATLPSTSRRASGVSRYHTHRPLFSPSTRPASASTLR